MFKKAPKNEMPREEAEALYKDLVSDIEAFKQELSYGEETLDNIHDETKRQHLMFARMVLQSLDEFSGRGLSIFAEKPRFRIPDLDLEDPDSLKKAIQRLKIAEQVFRPK